MTPTYYRVVEKKPTGLDGGIGYWYKLSTTGLEDPKSEVVTVVRFGGDRPSELVEADVRFIVHLEVPRDSENTEVIVLQSTEQEDK